MIMILLLPLKMTVTVWLLVIKRKVMKGMEDGADQEDGDEDNFVEENYDVPFTLSFHSHALRKNQTFRHKSR